MRYQSLRNLSITLVVGLALAFSGCNKGESGASPSTKSATSGTSGSGTAAEGKNAASLPDSSAKAANASGKWTVRVDENGRKWWGEVPYDVFFDDPLGKANETGPVPVQPGPAVDPEQKPTVPEPTEPRQPEVPAPSADTWDTLITAEALDSEVKNIRNFLNSKLQSVGQYSRNLAMIPTQTATLAALAAVAARHPGEITWKDDALYIRDLAGKMNAEPLRPGPKFQRELLGLFEQISDTLNRSRPADLPDPDPEADIADSAEMRLLMKRMDDAYKKMKTEAGGEDGFRKNLDMVRQEAAVLSTLAKVVTLEGYGYVDDEEFIAFARTVSDQGRKIGEATALESFTEYDMALSTAYQACTRCHTDYKD